MSGALRARASVKRQEVKDRGSLRTHLEDLAAQGELRLGAQELAVELLPVQAVCLGAFRQVQGLERCAPQKHLSSIGGS